MTVAELRKLAVAIRLGNPVTQDSVLAAIEGAAAAIEAAEQTATAAIVEAHVRAGRVTPALREDAMLLAKSLSPEALDARLARWPSVIRPSATGRVDANGPDGGDPLRTLESLARGIEQSESCTYAEAFARAAERNPQLYKAARENHFATVKKGSLNVSP